jgi:uncharacterized protein (UPF0332 family)
VTEETRVLVKYRIERALESLDEARILLKGGHANTFVNRLYYGCFYAVSALLLSKGLYSSKHSGIRSLFHQNYIRPCIIDANYGQLYDKLFDNRQKADYADLIRFNIDEVHDWLYEAEGFVNTIQGFIER